MDESADEEQGVNNSGSGAAAGVASFFTNAAAWVAGAFTTVGGWFSSFFSLLAPAATAPKPSLPTLPKSPKSYPTIPTSKQNNPVLPANKKPTKPKFKTRNDPTKKKKKQEDVMEKAEINSVQSKNDTENGNNSTNRDMMEDFLYSLIPGMKSPVPAFTKTDLVPDINKKPSHKTGKELEHPILSNQDDSQNSITHLLTKFSKNPKGKNYPIP